MKAVPESIIPLITRRNTYKQRFAESPVTGTFLGWFTLSGFVILSGSVTLLGGVTSSGGVMLLGGVGVTSFLAFT